jgi:type VI protein secretion system component Hcp
MAPQGYFLKLDSIDGGSQDKDHRIEIEIRPLSLGTSQRGSFAAGGRQRPHTRLPFFAAHQQEYTKSTEAMAEILRAYRTASRQRTKRLKAGNYVYPSVS